jgi:hypothetical protein
LRRGRKPCVETCIFPLEGPARQIRRITFDNPFRFRGHDKRAPPNVRRTSFDYPFPSEGPACQVRLEGRACRVRKISFDSPFRFSGHDEHAPPIFPFGGTRSSRPMRNVG